MNVTIRPMRNLTIVFVTLAIVAGMTMEVNAMDHPFLIVKKSDYADGRTKGWEGTK